MWLNFAKAIHELQRTFAEAFGSYHPELHYMRGPGPKWRAKRSHVAAGAAQPAVPTATLREIVDAHA
jgi:hypothetical protein